MKSVVQQWTLQGNPAVAERGQQWKMSPGARVTDVIFALVER